MDQPEFRFALSGWRLRHIARPQPKRAPHRGASAQKPGSRETASGLFVCAFDLQGTNGSGHRHGDVPMEFFNKVDCHIRAAFVVRRCSSSLQPQGTNAAAAKRSGSAGVARRTSLSLPTAWRRFDSGRPLQTTVHAHACTAAWSAPAPVGRWPCLVSRRSVFDSRRGHQIRLCRSKDRMPRYERGDGRSIRPGGANRMNSRGVRRSRQIAGADSSLAAAREAVFGTHLSIPSGPRCDEKAVDARRRPKDSSSDYGRGRQRRRRGFLVATLRGRPNPAPGVVAARVLGTGQWSPRRA